MNRKLCSALGTPMGSFPTPTEILRFKPDELSGKCRLGYRSKWIRAIADLIVEGGLDLDVIERGVVCGSVDERKDAERRLRDLPGVGPFAHANILQLFGRTDALPFDTETCRLWSEEHGATTDKKRRRSVMGDAEAYYRTHYTGHEWQAYWFDLWRNYETRRGGMEAPCWVIPSKQEEEAAFSFRVSKASMGSPRKKLRTGLRVSPISSGSEKCGRRRAARTTRVTLTKALEKVTNSGIEAGKNVQK